MKIYKYRLDVENDQRISMPTGSEILSIQGVSDQICMWVRVVPDGALVKRHLKIYGTGHELGSTGVYVGTAVTMNGRLVWHVFDCGEER